VNFERKYMKSGKYKVSFTFELGENMSMEKVEEKLAELISDACDDDNFPVWDFELLEEFEVEYNTEEETLEELSF
jgi:hypothetical protein